MNGLGDFGVGGVPAATISGNTLYGFGGSYFLNDDMAIRAGIGFRNYNENSETTGGESDYTKMGFGISPAFLWYFGGEGPQRNGCVECGGCLAGCAHDAKNTLDKNYLYLAEKLGAQIHVLHQVTMIRPIDGGYQVNCVHPLDKNEHYPPLTARKVVLSAGVLGTLELLFRCREAGTLPQLSQMLGQRVALVADDFSFEPYALVIRRNDPDFRLAVNCALVGVYKSGDIDAVFQRWLAPLGRPGPLLHAMY